MPPPGTRGNRLMSWCTLPHSWNAWPPAQLFVQEVAAAQHPVCSHSQKPAGLSHVCSANLLQGLGSSRHLGVSRLPAGPWRSGAFSGSPQMGSRFQGGPGPCVSKDRPWRPVVSGRLCSWKPEAGAHVIPPSSPRMSQK